VVVTDTLPSAFGLVSSSVSNGGNCAGAATVTCTFGTVPAGSSVTATIVASTPTLGSFANAAAVTATVDDPKPDNNVATFTTPVYPPGSTDLTVTSSSTPAAVKIGSQVTTTIKATNNGPGPATGVSIVDAIPGAAYVSATSTQGTCTHTTTTVTCAVGS